MIFNLILIIITIFCSIVMISAFPAILILTITNIEIFLLCFAYWATIFITIKYIIELIRKK
jgi:hypothetical protein